MQKLEEPSKQATDYVRISYLTKRSDAELSLSAQKKATVKKQSEVISLVEGGISRWQVSLASKLIKCMSFVAIAGSDGELLLPGRN